jgi:hypothetical protein
VAKLSDISPFELGRAVTHIREFLTPRGFHEVILNPFDAFPIDFKDDVLDLQNEGQLRFNTEPEIWSAASSAEKFYSISPLFRRENSHNLLRRSAFFILDIYQISPPEALLPIFKGIIDALAEASITPSLKGLPIVEGTFDPTTDGPTGQFEKAQWVITSGYNASNSFYEVDAGGHSTRREIFLMTPSGFLEVGVVGITGWNRNPEYHIRDSKGPDVTPDLNRSGLGIGIERLLLSEQLVSMTERPVT